MSSSTIWSGVRHLIVSGEVGFGVVSDACVSVDTAAGVADVGCTGAGAGAEGVSAIFGALIMAAVRTSGSESGKRKEEEGV